MGKKKEKINQMGEHEEQGRRHRKTWGRPTYVFQMGKCINQDRLHYFRVKHHGYLRALAQQWFVSSSFYMSLKVSWDLHSILQCVLGGPG